MDQVKEILRLMIKFRFWIAVGIAALLPLIAYFIGAGKINKEADAGKATVDGAVKAVSDYASPDKATPNWITAVKGRTVVLGGDVKTAWRKLYDRQGPLLQWPKDPPEIEEKMLSWGKKWPEGVDPSAVQIVIDKYILAYPDAVKKVYEIPRPWNFVDGTGVVECPPVQALLQPIIFDPDKPPSDLGKVWSAQEKLWVCAAALDVIDKVNKNAKDWDSAPIKRVVDLQVANPLALDQVSFSKGVTLKPAPTLTQAPDPAAAAAAAAAAPPPDAAGGDPAAMAGMPGAAGGEMMGAGGQPGQTVGYLSSSNEQFQVVPIALAVLIDQNSINNFLVALANSPMAIQVIDYQQMRPQARLVKPVKGQAPTGFNQYGGGFAAAGEGLFNAGDMPGYGGRMFERMAPGGFADDPAAGAGMGAQRYGRATEQRGKVDLRSRDLKKEAEERKKREHVEVKIHDPYYNILEVRVYCQARFYNSVPADLPVESASPGDTAATGTVEPGAQPAPAAPPAAAAADATKTEPAKAAEAPAAEPAPAPAKAETPAPQPAKAAEATPKQEPTKAESPKGDAPAPDAAKNQPPAADAPKNESPKAPEPAPKGQI